MGEDLANDAGILNGRDQTHAAATARTREHVKLKGAPHQVSPGPVAGFVRTGTLEFTDAVRAGLGRGRLLRDLRVLGGGSPAAPAGMGGEGVVERAPFRGSGTATVELWGPGAGGYRGWFDDDRNRQPRWTKAIGCPDATITRDGMFVLVTGDPDHPEYDASGSPDCDTDLPTYVFDREGNAVLRWPYGGDRNEMSEAVFARTGRRLAFPARPPSWDGRLLPDASPPDLSRRTYKFSPDGTMLLATRDRDVRLYREPK